MYLLLETVRAVLGLDEELLTGESVGEVVERIYEIWEQNTSGKLFAFCPSPGHDKYSTDMV